jgi:hypothetical protein
VRGASDAAVHRIAEDQQIVPHMTRFAADNERLYAHSTNTAAYAIALASRRDEIDEDLLRTIGTGALAHASASRGSIPTCWGATSRRSQTVSTHSSRSTLSEARGY